MAAKLVLGSAGFVGRPFCEYLRARGDTVVEMDVKDATHKDARLVTLPLSNVDYVYFLAWDVGGSKYLNSEGAQFRQLERNLPLMENVFSQLRARGTPFTFVSSQLATEVDSVYGVTKRLGEVWTKLLGGTVVRLQNVYGAYEPMSERSHVVADFVHQALSAGAIQMMTTGTESRDFIHIDDVCSGLAACEGLGGSYDVCTHRPVLVAFVAEVIALGTWATVLPGWRLGGRSVPSQLSSPPMWLPTVRIGEGLERTVRLFMEKRDAKSD